MKPYINSTEGIWPKLTNPKQMNQDNFEGKVISLGEGMNEKPSLAVLDGNELVMFTVHCHINHAMQVSEDQFMRYYETVMYRSKDGGSTWEGKHVPFKGYEPSATVIDGVIYVHTGEYAKQWIFDESIARIYCSRDKGETWEEYTLKPEIIGKSGKQHLVCSRNFIKLNDGRVAIMLLSDGESYRLSSSDEGRSWKAEKVTENVNYSGELSVLCEAVMFRTPSKRLMAVGRVFLNDIKDDIPGKPKYSEGFQTDQGMGMILIESKDEGLSWNAVRALGYMGYMYPSVVYTDNSHFILTYTMRECRLPSPHQHMGVQAVFGTENADGSFDIDFENDIAVIDDRTPDCSSSAGGYGMTSILPDGSFVTPYSYRTLMPEFQKKLEDGTFKEDAFFEEYALRSGFAKNGKADLDWWHVSGDSQKRHIIGEYAMAINHSFVFAQVLKWKIK